MIHRIHTSLAGLALSCALLLGAPSARADGSVADKATAESLYQAGLKLMNANNFAEACPKFVESQRLDPGTGTQIALAKCYDGAGKTASAWALYKELAFVFKKNNNEAGEKAATAKAAELEKKLSKLQINVTNDAPSVVIRRDNEEVGKATLGTPIAVDPGKHVIEATAPGFQVWSTTIVIGKENDSKSVTIPALTEAPKASNSLRTVSYIVGGVGVAGLVVGGVFGGLAVGDKGKLGTDCPNNVCSTQASQDELASAKSKALISTIGLAAGGALAATGVVLFLVSGPKKSEASKTARLIPAVGPQGGGFWLQGSF